MQTTSTSAVDPSVAGDMRYVDWGAIIGGAVLSMAISIILLTFGAALGLSVISPQPGEGMSVEWFGIAAALWFLWVAISSFAAGGYLAGRLRRAIRDALPGEGETRDGAHGVLVWATGAIVGAILAASGVGNTLSAVGAGAGAATDAIATAATAAVEGGGASLLENAGALPTAEVTEAVGAVLSRAAVAGELTEADRGYLVRVAATGTGLSEAQVNERIDAAMAQVETARQTAIEAADTARIAGLIAAFVLAATMLAGAAAAYFAAVAGGQHRDEMTPFATAWRSGSTTTRREI